MTSAHSTRNTSIRTRKIRGEDSLVSSISIAEREEEPEAIDDVIRCEEPISGHQYGTAASGKKGGCKLFAAGKGELRGETGLRSRAYFINPSRVRRSTGFLPQKGLAT